MSGIIDFLFVLSLCILLVYVIFKCIEFFDKDAKLTNCSKVRYVERNDGRIIVQVSYFKFFHKNIGISTYNGLESAKKIVKDSISEYEKNRNDLKIKTIHY